MADSGLYHLREEGLLCDLVLRCSTDETEVLAHRVVLAGHSSYFKALLCGGWATDGTTTTIDVCLDQVKGDTLLCWIRAMYRSGQGRLLELQTGLQHANNVQELDVEKVKGLYQLCSFYDVPDILHWFDKLLFDYNKHVEVAIALLAMMGDREDVISTKKLVQLAARNLAPLLQSESRSLLQQLPSGTLQMILRHEENSTIYGGVRGMQNVEAIRIWLEGDPQARQSQLADLLNSLPMSYQNLWTQLHEACRVCKLLSSKVALAAFSAATHDVHQIVFDERSKCMPRHTSLKGLLVFGGRLDVWMGVRECELYDTRRDVWFPAPSLPSEATKVKGTSVPGGAFSLGARAEVFHSEPSVWGRGATDPGGAGMLIDASSASIDSNVYVIGGRVAGNHTSYMSRYSIDEDTWTALAGCREDRQNQGFASLGGRLYCVGGQRKKVLTSVESYQPELDHWHLLEYARLASAVKYPSLVAHEGRLFRIGGRNSERRILATVEAMDPREGFWSPLPPMLEARSSSGVASVGDALYVAGGTSSKNEELLTSMECFSSTAGKWFARAPMSTQRTCHTLAAVCVCACVQPDID